MTSLRADKAGRNRKGRASATRWGCFLCLVFTLQEIVPLSCELILRACGSRDHCCQKRTQCQQDSAGTTLTYMGPFIYVRFYLEIRSSQWSEQPHQRTQCMHRRHKNMDDGKSAQTERRQNRSSSLSLFVFLEIFYRSPPWLDYSWLSQHPLLWFWQTNKRRSLCCCCCCCWCCCCCCWRK